MNILGIHTSYTSTTHDPSACLMMNGVVIAAIEEERLNRIKTSSGFFPVLAINACLNIAGIKITDIDIVVSDGASYLPLKYKILRSLQDHFGYSPVVELIYHPYAHAAGSFFSSGFNKALVVSVDGVGDKVSTLVLKAEKVSSTVKFTEIYRGGSDFSLGNFYTTFTNYLGFRSCEGEYKVMGMAAYGQPSHDLSGLIRFDSSQGVLCGNNADYQNIQYYTSINESSYNTDYIYSLTKTKRPVDTGGKFLPEHFNLAASVQEAFTVAYIDLITYFKLKTGEKNLCISGGCALNCLANKELLKSNFEKIYAMPAASDRGLSMGSAMYFAGLQGLSITPPSHMYLGKSYSNDQIIDTLEKYSINYKYYDDPYTECANDIAEGKIIGWLNGRSEFGPRALGARSILANPHKIGMKNTLNAKIKFRESYRPFAPAILKEDLDSFINTNADLSAMMFTIDAPDRLIKKIPEAIHFDGTTRVQRVDKGLDNYGFYTLLTEVKKQVSLGAVINTSFNLAGEPIVDSPTDAIRTFYSSGIDVLYLENIKIKK